MTATIKLFAGARDMMGVDEIKVDLPNRATFRDLRDALFTKAPPLETLAERALFAANACYVTDEELVPESAEIALILPVSGG